MKHWREPVFVCAAILGLYAFYFSQPIYSVPPGISYAMGGTYAVFAVFRLKRDFDSRESGALVRFLLRVAAAALFFGVETITTL
jgi:hypothetical protein